MSLHLSQQEAAERARQLALDFIRQQDMKGWEWSLGVMPDPVDPKCRGRKVATQWIAVVRFSQEGATVDGCVTVKVNIESGTAEWADAGP